MTKLPRVSRVLVLLPLLAMVACATATTQPPADTSGSGGGTTSTTSTTTTTSSSSGEGGQGPCVGADDCAAFTDACHTGTCINGVCQGVAANEGAACDDGKNCTQSDHCVAGTCTGDLKACPASDACHVGSCDVATDQCVEVPGNDGAGCVDSDPCSLTAFCQTGQCVGGQQVDCSFLNSVCGVGYCDPAVGCIAMPLNDGTPCDDGQFCTINDTCNGGSCTGAANPCTPNGTNCMIGSCNEVSDTCQAVPGNDGAACDDGSACTSNEKCSNGTCGGGVAANPGGACDDADPCTLNTLCSGTSCAGGTQITQCISGDGCCPAGCLVGGDDDCSMTRWSDGTNAWPDEACNPSNSFGFCDSNAQDQADSWATAVCQNNGYSYGVWTGNKMAGCAGDISMWCMGTIPCTQTYETMCADFDQTQVEFTCFP